MLQRIQTFWMFLAIIMAILLFTTVQTPEDFKNIPCIKIGSALSFILGFISIFSFKKRKRQIALNLLNVIINVLLIGVLVFWILNLSGGKAFPEKGIELVFPAFAILCLLIANTRIRRDERLVKSVDRFR